MSHMNLIHQDHYQSPPLYYIPLDMVTANFNSVVLLTISVPIESTRKLLIDSGEKWL